tara:strand:- start:1336 stop:1779 length:444 start_codon:yes stop_codon:yes gene_type:complete
MKNKNLVSADGLNQVHIWEQAVVHLLNLDGWDLKHCGNTYEYWDAYGLTPKKNKCVIEMKFRNKYYNKKLLEVDKYKNLIKSNEIALYFVNDPKGNYLFWLNELKNLQVENILCPDTTLWTKKKILKPCYLIDESKASIVNLNGFTK